MLARSSIFKLSARTFANTTRLSSSSVAQQLSSTLQKEIEFEKNEASAPPTWLADFKKQGVWKIEDKVGEKEVIFSRVFNNEKISAIVSTDSVNESEELDMENEEESEAEEPRQFPVDMTVLIEKSVDGVDAGGLEIAAQISEGSVFINNVSYNSSSSSLTDISAEGDWKRRGAYGGPVFADLDELVQDQFHQMLAERGFDEQFTEFVPEYIEWKEEKEYINWLENTSSWLKK